MVSADSIVPDPTNPQSFNRYSYVNNNPINFTDPSGHFERDAIEEYLKDNYDDWETELEEWKSNKEWWAMLREAQAGDVLIAGAIDGMFYTFEGQDTTVLDGIYWSDPYGNAITKKHHHPNQAGYSLGDIYNFSGYADASWDGFIRWIFYI